MRIVLFTVDEPTFVPELLGPIIDRHGSSIVRAYVSRRLFDAGALLRKIPRFLSMGYPWCIRPSDWLGYARMLRQGRGVSVVSWLQSRGVPAEPIAEIRTNAARAKLAALDADVFLFCPFDQIAGPKFLAIPRLGTFNVHLGKLPEHRGGLSAFWVLAQGHPDAGATMHVAVPELDAGDIVAECRLPVRTHSMSELMRDTVRAAGPMVADGLDRLATGAWQPISTQGRPQGFYLFPSWRDFRQFYQRGCRLI